MIKLIAGDSEAPTFGLVLALEELGLDYALSRIDLAQFEQWDAAHRALSPTGNSPVLLADGHVMDHALLALFYLAEAHPETGLMPDDPVERYRMQAETAIMTRQMAGSLNMIGWAQSLPAEQRADYFARLGARPDRPKISGWSAVWRDAVPEERRLDDARAKVVSGMDHIAALLGSRDWLVGTRMTLADTVGFSLVRLAAQLIPDCSALSGGSPFTDWFARVAARQPARRATARLEQEGIARIFCPPAIQ